MRIKKSFFRAFISVLLIISLFTSLPITAFAAGDNDIYALTYLVGAFNISDENDGNISSTINGTKYYYSDDYGKYDDISENFSSMENQNVLYELHNSKIARVYSMDNVLVPTITVEPDVKEGLIYRNGKFSQSSFDLSIKLSVQPKSVFQENELFWFLSSDEGKDCLYITLKKLEVEPSGGMDFGSSGWWLWKDYQTKISEYLNDNVKVNETKVYHYTVNLQNDKVLNQKEYNIELYTTPTFDFGPGERTTSKIKVGNLDYQEEKTEEKKTDSTSGKSVTQASTTLEGVKSALQFSKNLLSSEQTNQINEYVNLWLSELILARYVDKSDIKQKVSEKIANEWLSKLGLDTSVLLVPGTIQATTYLKTQTKDGTKVFIELYINLTSFDFGNSGMPTMATGSGSATIYNMNGEKLDSSVILPAYADVCAFCEQLQKVAKDTIFNGAKQYRTIFGIDTDATAEALSSQIMAKLLNNKYTKDVFKKVDAKDVKTALKKLISEGDKKCGNKIFELVTTPSQNSTLVSVKCPVDVTVFDNDGNICGIVRNNVVDTLYGDVFINVVGDQKNIYLIGDDYTFTLSGTDSGTMDYVVTEFDESGNKSREITYSNIELSDGCKYYSYVPEAENHNSSLFDLTDSDGNVISATTGKESDTYITESSGKCGDDVYWTLYSDGTLFISGSGEMYVYDYSFASSSAPWYYWRNIIKTVIISNGVTTIGDFAFHSCDKLTSITISDSVTNIGDYAFKCCYKLKSITIPRHVTSIGNRAFEDCTSLTNIVIPESLTSIGYNAFCDCTSLTSISIPDKVTNIDIYTFSGCTNLLSVIIGNRVESISHRAFYNCPNLTNITIPDSVTSIDGQAFYGCTSKLCKINYKGTLDKWAEIKFKDNASNPLNYGSYLYINDELVTQARLTETKIINTWAFLNCKSLTSVIIGNSVASIGDCAFRDCTNLSSIIITDSVTSIGSLAFRGCTSLESLTIPNSVTSIGNDAFIGGKGLKSVMIPDSVIDIGQRAFGYYIDDKNYGVVKMEGFTIKGYKGTAAETYANINGFEFVNLDGQNENTYIDSKTNISVTITGNAELSVKKLTDSESLNKANNALGGSKKLVNLYDIFLTKDGETVQLDEPAMVKIPYDNENAKVYRIEDDGTATDMNAVYNNGYMVFTTDHFSLYVLVIPNDNVFGDVNGDDEVNAKDRMMLTRYLANWSGYENIDMTAADVNNDGQVNAKDRMILTRHIAKWQGYETLPLK